MKIGICLWCKEAPLMLVENISGFYVVCGKPFTQCPDACGLFPTADEAIVFVQSEQPLTEPKGERRF